MVMVTVWAVALLLLSVKAVELLFALAAVLLNVPLAMVRAVLTGLELTGTKAMPRKGVVASVVAMAVPGVPPMVAVALAAGSLKGRMLVGVVM